MVKGISRQVIMVDAPEPKLFEQAIFILKDDVGEGVTDDVLLKEAKAAIQGRSRRERRGIRTVQSLLWAAGGAALTGLAWLLTVLL